MAGKSCSNLEETVPVKNGCSEVGGYDCDFVESPADDLLCKICQYPARDPVLTECCGQNFCSHCLERYLQSTVIDHGSCPYCREEKFQTMPDKKTGRQVLNLKMFCPHKHQGCTWIGELRSMKDHVNKNSDNAIGCPFTELQCSNGCGVVMQRRLVEGHLKSECELREVKCEYCNTTGSYQWINSSHHEECPKYPVECPNHCEVGHVRREEISGHLEECPLAIVECPYAAVGCESVVRRKEEMEHVMGSVGQHMEYNKKAILANQNEFQKRLNVQEQEMENIKQDLRNKLIAKEQELDDIKRDLDTKEQRMVSINKDFLDKLKLSQETQSQLKTTITEKGRELDEVRKNAEENNKTLQKMIQQLKDRLEGTEQSLQHQVKVNTQLQLQVKMIFNSNWSLQLIHLANSEVVPVVIKLAEFKKYKNSECVYSTGFYTRDRGYKMCLRIYPNGDVGFSNNVTLDVHLMKGDHDDHLTWPVKGTLTVQLLNQLSDSNHSEPMNYHFDGSDATKCHRVMKRTRSSNGVLCSQFIPLYRLSYDAVKKCQYLKDDCVYFRVCNFQ